MGLSVTATPVSLPDTASLAALRAWHEGLSSKDAVTRYLSEARPPVNRHAASSGQSVVKSRPSPSHATVMTLQSTSLDLPAKAPRPRAQWPPPSNSCAAQPFPCP